MSYKGLCVSKIKPSFDEAIDALSVVDFPRPHLRKGEVRVKMQAAALNYFDLLMLVGKYQMKPALPFTPVHFTIS